jgi:hypothetical protein
LLPLQNKKNKDAQHEKTHSDIPCFEFDIPGLQPAWFFLAAIRAFCHIHPDHSADLIE